MDRLCVFPAKNPQTMHLGNQTVCNKLTIMIDSLQASLQHMPNVMGLFLIASITDLCVHTTEWCGLDI